MGELLNFYACADLAFVGGSLVPVGGHNLLESAALGLPTLCGPHMFATQDVADQMWEAGGVLQVLTAESLAAELVRLAANDQARQVVSERAMAVIEANRGALHRTLDLVVHALQR
jgi:3-deoxy-D-manno-octulosonic-acid transferase